MAHVHKSKLSLRISGDSLVPAEVSALLGAEPSFSQSKGEEIRFNQAGDVRIARTGMWLRSVDDRTPENLDGQLRKLFDEMSDDLSVWQRIVESYSADLFCGLFMQGSNEGLTISAGVMKMIAERRLEIAFDIYGEERTPGTTG